MGTNMEQVYTFHKTVRGNLHILNGFPCEDASESFSEDTKGYHIAVIADGHGAKSCFRSERGSKIVTGVALGCLKEFAETVLCSIETEQKFYDEIFGDRRYCDATLRHLTDRVVAGWYDRVMEDYERDRPTLAEMGDCAVEYQKGKNVTHIYGTTVIAALCLPCCLILMQQGDGRCDVFYSDGTVEQPIPWDPRCEDTTTTSMCDEDAAESFRTCIIDLRKKSVAACYLGCDGIEDAYRDTYEDLGGSHEKMGGVHTFYKDLSSKIIEKGINDFEVYLDEMLPEFSKDGLFSRSGSGDDVSVAGIVDMDAIGRLREKFQKDVKRYELEEKLFWKEDELRGKTRKREILKKRMEDAGAELQKEQAAQKNAFKEMLKKKEELMVSSEKLKAGLPGTELPVQLWKPYMIPRYSVFEIKRQMDTNRIVLGLKYMGESSSFVNCAMQGGYEKISEDIKQHNEDIKMLEKDLEGKKEKLKILEERHKEATEAFEEYDAKFQEIASDIKKIKAEMAMEIG